MANETAPSPPDRGDYPQTKSGQKAYDQAMADYKAMWGPVIVQQAKTAALANQAQESANTETARKQKELQDYQASTPGMVATVAKPLSFFGGGLAGGMEANLLGRALTGPSPLQASIGKRAAMFMPFALLGGASAGKAYDLYQQAQDPSNTPAARDWDYIGSNLGSGAALSNLGYGGFTSLKDIGLENALGQSSKSNPIPPPIGATGDTNTGAANELARSLNATPANAKGRTLDAVDAAIAGAPNAAIRNTAARISAYKDSALGGFNPKTATIAELRGAIGDFAKTLRRGGNLPMLLASLGVGVGAAALAPDEARASLNSLRAPPSTGEIVSNALGRMHDAAMAIPGQIASDPLGFRRLHAVYESRRSRWARSRRREGAQPFRCHDGRPAPSGGSSHQGGPACGMAAE